MSFFSLSASTPARQCLLHSSLLPTQANPPFTSKPYYNQVVLTRPRNVAGPLIMCCSNSSSPSPSSSSPAITTPTTTTDIAPPVVKKRKRYRKGYPGESTGISEEMRFVAMRLRNIKGKYTHKNSNDDSEEGSGKESENESLSEKEDGEEEEEEEEEKEEGSDDGEETWVPSMEGFVKYLVDSRLVFNTVESIVDKSEDVSYAYFRKTGLERAEGLARDLEWFTQQDVVIPEPSSPGVTYAKYLQELAENNPPLFLCHFYNIYFSHIAGGQVISKQVSGKLFEGRVLDFYRWDGDAEELLKGLREKLNMLGKNWTRDEKNKCLKESTKSFRYLGQIVRLIIL